MMGAFLAVGFENLRIDQAERLTPVFRHIHDQKSDMAINLGRGESDSGRFVHGFEHIADQLTQFIIEFDHRFCNRSQAWVRKM